ncbi:unnamed protein product, partial [Sphacelaria rigidula]
KKKRRRRIGSFSALKNRYIQVCSPASNFHTFDLFILHHAVEEIYAQANSPQVYPLPGKPCLKVGRQMTGTIMGDSISSHPSIYRKNIFLFIYFLFIVASQSPSVSTANHTIVGTAPQHDYTCDL